MRQEGYHRIFVGKIEKSELINIVREVKSLWQFGPVIWPGGDSKKRAKVKAVKDSADQYWVLLNDAALTYLLLRCKDIFPVKVVGSDGKPEPPISLDDIPF